MTNKIASLDFQSMIYLTKVQASELAVSTVMIHTAEFDPVRDEGRAYADKLSLASVAVTYVCHHYGMTTAIPYARTAIKRIGAEVRAALCS